MGGAGGAEPAFLVDDPSQGERSGAIRTHDHLRQSLAGTHTGWGLLLHLTLEPRGHLGKEMDVSNGLNRDFNFHFAQYLFQSGCFHPEEVKISVIGKIKDSKQYLGCPPPPPNRMEARENLQIIKLSGINFVY